MLIDELLNDNTYHIEFNGHLTNHSKHAVIALAGLGVCPQKIKAYYDNHAEQTTYGFGLELPKPSKYEINGENWQKYLGKRTSFSSYCRFFAEQEQKLGMHGLINAYVPALLPGWVGSFTHATIHLGWALSVGNRYMAIEGLAYMAFSYVSCHPERMTTDQVPATGDGSPTGSLLAIADRWDANRPALKRWVKQLLDDKSPGVIENIHPELMRSGLQYRIARMLAEGHPLMYQTPGWLRETDPAETWEGLYAAVSLLYLSVPGDFVLLHLITSLFAMEQIAGYLPASQQKEVIKCYWIGMLGIVFSGADFSKAAKLRALDNIYGHAHDPVESPAMRQEWEQIVARAVEEEEEHNPKLVYVMQKMWAATGGKTLYRAAAAQFTKTPNLPDSFEEPPVDEQDVENFHEKRSLSGELAGGNVHLLPQTNYLRALHTMIRDKHALRSDLVFYSGKIISKLVETSIDLIPFEERTVQTPIGEHYQGLQVPQDICGVSVLRAGESMEIGLREAFRSVRIGKILIQRDKVTKLPHLYYTSLPDDISKCHVLLMDPMLATGGTALAAIGVLLDKGVLEKNIIFVNLIAVSQGLRAVRSRYPQVRIVTSAIDERLNENAYMIPGIGDFGDRYFGTDK